MTGGFARHGARQGGCRGRGDGGVAIVRGDGTGDGRCDSDGTAGPVARGSGVQGTRSVVGGCRVHWARKADAALRLSGR